MFFTEVLEIYECDGKPNYVCGNLWEDYPCEKDPQHRSFVPVSRFALSDLMPAGIRHQSVLDYVRAHEKLTVKVVVKRRSEARRKAGTESLSESEHHTKKRKGSQARSQKILGQNKFSPCRSDLETCKQCRRCRLANRDSEVDKGNSTLLVSEESTTMFATGYAWCGVDKSEFPCPVTHTCSRGDCPDSLSTDHMAHGGIVVYTNKHVIFDDEEARSTEVEFSFGDGEVIVAFGVKLKEDRSNKDLVGLEVCSHRPELYDKLGEFSERASLCWDDIPASVKEELKNHALVISHPHGKDKVVSIGPLVCLEREEEWTKGRSECTPPSNRRKVTRYLAATCPGSSGAPVLTGYYPHRPFTHSSADNRREENFCMSY